MGVEGSIVVVVVGRHGWVLLLAVAVCVMFDVVCLRLSTAKYRCRRKDEFRTFYSYFLSNVMDRRIC